MSASDPSASPAPTVSVASYWVAGVLFAIAGILGFSLRPILIRLSYELGADPITLLALRMVFSLPFFLAVALWTRRGSAERRRLSGREFAAVAGLGLLGYYLASFLDFLGLQYVSAALGRLLIFLYPTFVVMLSALFLKRPPNPRELVALAVTYGGVALVLSEQAGGPSGNLLLGAALVIGSAAAYAVYLVAGSQVVLRTGSLRFTAYAMTVASLACIAQFLILKPLSALDLPIEVYVLAFVMATVSTVVPVFLTSEALRRIGANHVAMLGALGPVSTIVLGHLGLDEVMTLPQLAGAVLVVGGVLVVSLKPRSRAG